MTDTVSPPHHNENSKRSLSPDEGEIVDDTEYVKRRRDSRSPAVVDRFSNGERSRRHRVAYEDEQGGYRDRRAGYYDGRRYDSRAYRDYDRPSDRPRYDDDREHSWHSRERPRDSPSRTYVPRNRSLSTESHDRRGRTSSPQSSSRNTHSPSPHMKVQFTEETKPAAPYYPTQSPLTVVNRHRFPSL
jgi:hypothetical protein